MIGSFPPSQKSKAGWLSADVETSSRAEPSANPKPAVSTICAVCSGGLPGLPVLDCCHFHLSVKAQAGNSTCGIVAQQNPAGLVPAEPLTAFRLGLLYSDLSEVYVDCTDGEHDSGNFRSLTPTFAKDNIFLVKNLRSLAGSAAKLAITRCGNQMAGGLVSISGLQLRTLHTSPVRSTTSSSSLPGFVSRAV